MTKMEAPVFIGIDPGQTCGMAYRWPAWKTPNAVAIPITRLSTLLQDVHDRDGERAIIFIEKASGRWGRFREHQANANSVMKAVREVWVRKCRIFIYDPRTWQKGMLTGVPGETTKEQSLLLAAQLAPIHIHDHNQADAICILEYGWAQYRDLILKEDWVNTGKK